MRSCPIGDFRSRDDVPSVPRHLHGGRVVAPSVGKAGRGGGVGRPGDDVGAGDLEPVPFGFFFFSFFFEEKRKDRVSSREEAEKKKKQTKKTKYLQISFSVDART